MGSKLSAEERAKIEKMLADDDTADDDFDVEIWEGDRGARVPYSRGKSWLQEHFRIDLSPDAEPEPEPDAKPARPRKPGPAADQGEGGEVRRFGGRRVS